MKSDLQHRAELAAERFHEGARRPIVIEFAGIPKAGKTTTLGQVHSFLKRCGFRVETVVERASVCPIKDKKSANFNVWTACTTLAQLLEKTQDPPGMEDPQILFLDRGLFDSICWLTMMDRLARITTVDREMIETFLRIEEWRKRITGVVMMTASPKDALHREAGYLPVEGAMGSIMNEEVLTQVLETTRECARKYSREFRILEVDTSSGDLRNHAERTAEVVAYYVLDLIEEHLKENILSLPRKAVAARFAGNRAISEKEAADLAAEFISAGTFRPRDEVEADVETVQVIPAAVIRNKSGHVLRLRRRERSEANVLHQELVIWAGGHVRKEDATNGDPLLHCVLRELREELRLSVEPQELKLLGAVYSSHNSSALRHVAIVYEWRAETDDVAVALSSAEFFERRGTALSGKFVSIEELSADSGNVKEMEDWSAEILQNFLLGKSSGGRSRMF